MVSIGFLKQHETFPRRALVLMGIGLALIYTVTTSMDRPASIDPQANSLAAYSIAKTRSPILKSYESIVAAPETAGNATWIVASPRGPISQYPPGTALLAAPLYLMADSELNHVRDLGAPYPEGTGAILLPDMWPAALTAVIASVVSMVSIGVILAELGLDRPYVIGAPLAIGLGTGVWSVASDALWQHGPGIMLIALGAWSVRSRDRAILGFIVGMLVPLVRAPVVLITGFAAIGAAIEHRDRRLMTPSLAGSAIGLACLILYNRYFFGSFSISGGYSSSFVDRILAPDLGFVARNLISAMFATDRGVFVWSPFLLLTVLAIPFVWRGAPTSVKFVSLGSVAYILVQFAANRYGGGFDFAFYRYPLEPIVGLIPLGALATARLFDYSRWVSTLFRLLVGVAVVAHAVAAVMF